MRPRLAVPLIALQDARQHDVPDVERRIPVLRGVRDRRRRGLLRVGMHHGLLRRRRGRLRPRQTVEPLVQVLEEPGVLPVVLYVRRPVPLIVHGGSLWRDKGGPN
jgi:hypothetical protein